GVGEHRLAIIGQNKTSKALAEVFTLKQRLGYRVVDQFKTFDDIAKSKIKAMKKEDKVDELILAEPEISRQSAAEIIAFCDAEHLGFQYAADLFTTAVGRSVIHTYAGIPVIEVRKTPLDGWGAIYKRLFDIVVSLILIVLTSPIQLIAALALFIEQPGRVFFSRLSNNKKTMRIGQDGKPFHYFKFRSMIKDAHNFRFDEAFVKKHGNLREGTPLFKLKDDPRVTRVGKFLRRYSIDELPEFFLVLRGRMSLIGPRPHLPEEVEKYATHHKKVHTVKPGITGLSQISGRADLDFEDEVRLDIHYIEHWSPWLDLYILFKTPLVVLFRRGAY
ncbi:sugar transferase, partial [Patescibacteria group bacterium]